jgi:5-(carboxyamino)imidazole ribonucleotide synthase
VEGFIGFDREVSVVVARTRDGKVECFEATENEHRDHILKTSHVPAKVTPALATQARQIATRIAKAFDYVGVLAVEMFVVRKGRRHVVLVNEIAPRVHNSGHWTIEGADTSQFENHVRAIAGLPLGSTRARGHSAMINLIGELPAREALLREAGLHWHDYGKTARPGRKLGHLTLTETSPRSRDLRTFKLLSRIDRATWLAIR